MELIFQQLNPQSCLSYLIGSADSNEVAIVDPVIDSVDDYMKLLAEHKYKLKYVIDSHIHADHISGASKLIDLTGCQYVMHQSATPKTVTVRVSDGDEIKIGNLPVKILHTPGHTHDSITLVLPDRIITGDVLFLDDAGAGRDDLPGGNAGDHWQSLQKLLALPDHLLVYPCHEYRGRQPSPLAVQKKTNPLFGTKSKTDYVAYLESLRLKPAEWMKAVLQVNHECTRDPKATHIPADTPACEITGSFSRVTASKDIGNIQPAGVKQAIDGSEQVLLLDVRELSELHGELGHIKGIVHIPLGQLPERLTELDKYKSQKVITICKMGGRATKAGNILSQNGFNNVLVMEGGMTAWKEQGLPSQTAETVSLTSTPDNEI